MELNFDAYKNRKGEEVMVSRLNTKEQMVRAYEKYLESNPDYELVGGDLVKCGKRVALGDYLVSAAGRVFTEVDGMFKQTYYPAGYSADKVRKWLDCPTLILRRTDTADEALAMMDSMSE